MKYSKVINFWFEKLSPEQWWAKDAELDKKITEEFLEIHTDASHGECYQWREAPRGWLAEIIILDQFSRNIYRDYPRAFAQDGQAIILAQEAISNGVIDALTKEEKGFVFMPFMHSESQAIHKIAEGLYKDLGIEGFYEAELKHKAIIDRFGRYPHRNAILKRASTDEELDFLKEPNSSF